MPRCAALGLSLAALLCAPQSEAQVPVWNVTWGGPQGGALGLGLLIGGTSGDNLKLAKRSLLIEARPGVDGGALHLGFVPISGSAKGLQFAGVAIKGTWLRTWGSPGGDLQPGVDYLGAEVHGAWVFKASLGVLWRVSGHTPSPNTLFTWSVGFGL
jgi:hypothetical protein